MKRPIFNTLWDEYQDDELLNLDKPELWTNKSNKVIEMIKKVNANSIIDIAGNSGFFCFAMAKEYKQCIVCDLDETAIEKSYNKIKDEKYDNITPVVMNFKKIYMKLGQMTEEERFKSDLVLAIALEHHLVFLEQLTFDEIFERLSGFSNKYLLIEFTMSENEFISKWMNEDFSWYTYENFLESLNKKFKVLFTDNYEKDRILLMCEKING